MLSQNTVKFLRAYFDKHLQTTASENVFMKLRKIKNHSQGVLTCTLKKKFFSTSISETSENVCFYSIAVQRV